MIVNTLMVPKRKISCAFLLPQSHFSVLKSSLITNRCNIAELLSRLLEKQRHRIIESRKIGKVTVTYQRKGQNLSRIPFRMSQSQWADMQVVARMCGISVSALVFSLLTMGNISMNKAFNWQGVPWRAGYHLFQKDGNFRLEFHFQEKPSIFGILGKDAFSRLIRIFRVT